MSEAASVESADFLQHAGETGKLIAAYDWSSTALGPIQHWPQSLKTAVSMIVHSPVPIVMLWGEDGFMIYNDAYSVFAGGRHPQQLGMKVREGWPEVADFNDHVMKVGLAGGTLAYRDQELTLYRHGRPEQVWMNLDYSPVYDESGRPAGVIAIVVETTERVQSERRSRSQHDRMVGMFEQAPGFMALVAGPDHVFELANPAYLRLIGRTEILGKSVREVIPEIEAQGFLELLDDVYRSGKAFVGSNVRVVLKSQAESPAGIHYVDFVYQPIRDSVGAVSGIFVQGSDVTDRMRVEELRTAQGQLLEAAVSEAPLKDLLDNLLRTVEARSAFGMLGSILLLDGEGTHLLHGGAPSLPVAYNEAIDGIEVGPAVGSCGTAVFRKEPVYVTDIAHDPLWADFRDLALSHGLRACWSIPIIHPAGQLLGTFAMYYPEPREPNAADLEIVEFVTRSASLVIQRKQAEEALRLQAEEFQTLADNIPTLCWMAEPEGQVFWFNRRWYDYTGMRPDRPDEWDLRSIIDPELFPRVVERWRHSIESGEPFEMTFPLKGVDARFRPFLTRMVPIRSSEGRIVRWFGTNVDVTEQVEAEALLERRVAERTTELLKAEEALRQSQKMEAMGQLTGGVAHDFNNLLTPILGSLDLLHHRKTGTQREQRLIDGALQSAERAKTLVQRLLAFARRQPLQPSAVDVTHLIRGMAELVASTTGPQIKVVVEAADELPPAIADPNQLEMAILNLSVNARDAMPDGGTLRISAASDEISEAKLGLKPGRYIRLSVADTGLGMDQATLARAIEPFFSTKGIGKGTGLGLSMVHGLASQLGGALTVSSRPGLGTNVELWLPIASRPAEAMTSAEAPSSRATGIGTALLVDDDDLVRASTTDIIAELGYDVVEAGSAEEALRLVEDGLSPTLLVTDHLMPGMHGTDLARRVRDRLPGAQVLIVSGYAEVEDIAGDLPRLTKPFRRADLVDAIAALGAPILPSV